MDEETTTPEAPKTTFRFITGLGPTGPENEIEFVLGYRIESATEMEQGRPKILDTRLVFEHLSTEQLEGLREQINGVIGQPKE